MAQRVTLYSGTPAVGSATTTSTPVLGIYAADVLVLTIDLASAATDAIDTLDVFVDTSVDGGTIWTNAIHATQLVGTGGAKRETYVINPYGVSATAPVNTAADAAAGALRHIMGDSWRVRLVQVDANSNAAFPITVKAFFLGGVRP